MLQGFFFPFFPNCYLKNPSTRLAVLLCFESLGILFQAARLFPPPNQKPWLFRLAAARYVLRVRGDGLHPNHRPWPGYRLLMRKALVSPLARADFHTFFFSKKIVNSIFVKERRKRSTSSRFRVWHLLPKKLGFGVLKKAALRLISFSFSLPLSLPPSLPPPYIHTQRLRLSCLSRGSAASFFFLKGGQALGLQSWRHQKRRGFCLCFQLMLKATSALLLCAFQGSRRVRA